MRAASAARLGGLARDGDYGTLTTKAVKNFQRSRGMRVDGVVGPNMWSKLRDRLPAQGTAIFSANGVHWFACRNSANTKIQLAVRNRSGKTLLQSKVLSSDSSGYKIGTVARGELRRTSFYEEGSKRTCTRMTGYFSQSWTVRRTESFLRGRLPVCR
ncbi:peptidoglycan-binding protein [Nocardioides sp. NPDC057772]|uniref:peptidoglycan-binding domain-containing protein n=1 Tax=Nocardioides sp. NPDC057772 TaxID=3346245 RepID=UPI00366D0154